MPMSSPQMTRMLGLFVLAIEFVLTCHGIAACRRRRPGDWEPETICRGLIETSDVPGQGQSLNNPRPVTQLRFQTVEVDADVIGRNGQSSCPRLLLAYSRSDLKPDRTSSENSCGCSQAAKCPPLARALKWMRLR
jgi:hypothetical protein